MKNKKMEFISVKDIYYLAIILLIKVNSWFYSPVLKKFIVSGITLLAYGFSIKKRRVIEKNLSKAFGGGLSEEQRREIIKGAFREFWRDMFLWLPSDPDRDEFRRAELRGVEHLRRALENGRGVILWESNGYGRKLASKHILNQNGFSICQVHGTNHLGGFLTEDSSGTWARRSIINRFFERCEKQFVGEVIVLPGSSSLAFTRLLLSRLKQNSVLCISGDGKTGQKLIPLKFLGQTDFFSTGMVSLARTAEATILPMFCVVEKDGRTSLIIERSIHTDTDADREHFLENSVAEYVGLLEAYIRRYPEQYRNWHLVGNSPEVQRLKDSQEVTI